MATSRWAMQHAKNWDSDVKSAAYRGVTLASGEFESHGSCVLGDCVCDAYPCVGARCANILRTGS